MRKRSHGAALLAAMLTVTLVATIAASALWQQWRSLEVEEADRSRVQSSWILTGALDWARLILREDASADRIDHLAEPWAVPLQEARLSTFLAADQNNNAEAGDADNVFLSGEISDLQGKMNLSMLAQRGTVDLTWAENFKRLFQVLNLPEDQLAQLQEGLRFASDLNIENRSGSKAPLPPQRLEQIAWLGVRPETIAALEPYVTVLPGTNLQVNINTAPAEVLYAIGRGYSLADAKGIVAQRDRQAFRLVTDAVKLLPAGATLANGVANVETHFFEVRGRLRLNDVVIEERSLVQRTGRIVHTLQRERGAFQAFAPDAPRR
jgi:general secretion pathway protein K